MTVETTVTVSAGPAGSREAEAEGSMLSAEAEVSMDAEGSTLSVADASELAVSVAKGSEIVAVVEDAAAETNSVRMDKGMLITLPSS